MHLTDEFVERKTFQVCHLGIVVGTGSGGVFIGFEEQAVKWAGKEGLVVVVNAETEVNGGWQ